MTKQHKQSARMEKLGRTKNKKGKSPNTPRAQAKMRHQPSDDHVSLKATPIRKKPAPKQLGKPVSIEQEVAQKIKKTKNFGEFLRRKGKGISNMTATVRLAIYDVAAELYAAAQLAARDADLWEELSEDPVWAKYENPPTDVSQADALRLVMLRAFDGHTRPGQQKASKYHCALKVFFADGVPANDLPAKIKKAHGIEALARANAESRTKQETAKPKESAKDRKGSSGSTRTSGDAEEQSAVDATTLKETLIGKREVMKPLLDLLHVMGSGTKDIRVKAGKDEKGRPCLEVVKLLSKGASGPTTSERRTSKTRRIKPRPPGVKNSSQKRRKAH